VHFGVEQEKGSVAPTTTSDCRMAWRRTRTQTGDVLRLRYIGLLLVKRRDGCHWRKSSRLDRLDGAAGRAPCPCCLCRVSFRLRCLITIHHIIYDLLRSLQMNNGTLSMLNHRNHHKCRICFDVFESSIFHRLQSGPVLCADQPASTSLTSLDESLLLSNSWSSRIEGNKFLVRWPVHQIQEMQYQVYSRPRNQNLTISSNEVPPLQPLKLRPEILQYRSSLECRRYSVKYLVS